MLRINLVDVLSQIRKRMLAVSHAAWPTLAKLLDSQLADPLSPFALLPIATGLAVGASLEVSIRATAALLLSEQSLRIVDDCADGEAKGSLHASIGMGRAMNVAQALQCLGHHELALLPLPARRLKALTAQAAKAQLEVCRGQDLDMQAVAQTLAEYQAVVEHKTVSAYEFFALAGAMVGTDKPHLLDACARCGAELGWMAQILNDIAAVWFPKSGEEGELRKPSFPVLFGLSLPHKEAESLAVLHREKSRDRERICALLDAMDVRRKLLGIALDHRDRALCALAPADSVTVGVLSPLSPDGAELLRVWLDWLFQDVAGLFAVPVGFPADSA